MPFNTAAVTNYLLDEAERKGIAISPMKLQKLLYFAHGTHLAMGHGPLLSECIEAWQYGPVVSDVYHEFKRFGNNPIGKERWKKVKATSEGKRKFALYTPSINECGGDVDSAKEVIDGVLEAFGEIGAIKLSKMTHAANSPWDEVWKKSDGRKGVDIPDQLIESYFRQSMGQ